MSLDFSRLLLESLSVCLGTLRVSGHFLYRPSRPRSGKLGSRLLAALQQPIVLKSTLCMLTYTYAHTRTHKQHTHTHLACLQGRFEYHGKTPLLLKILSGVVIVLATVYGYITSQRDIAGMLRNAAGDRAHSNSVSSNSVGGVNNTSKGGSMPVGFKRTTSLSMTGLVEQQDLESGHAGARGIS